VRGDNDCLVLVADWEPDFFHALTLALQNPGVRIERVTSGIELVRRLAAPSQRTAMIISRNGLDGVSALDLLSVVAIAYTAILCVISADAPRQTEQANLLYVGPWVDAELASRVNRLLHGETSSPV
jgi:CheY-like chemotaxis protein